MSHYFHVTLPDENDTELHASLNVSGKLSNFYRAFNAEEFDRGTNGDGIVEVSRNDIEEAKIKLNGDSRLTSFLSDILDESDSDLFILHLS
jgi:hypothetical protein